MSLKLITYGVFEWDLEKARLNLDKHQVDFFDAMAAFHDIDRIIATDDAHSSMEPRYFCLGIVHGKVMTVRFTYRHRIIRIIGAGYWRRGKQLYEEERKKTSEKGS